MQNHSIYPAVVCLIILMLCFNKMKTFLEHRDDHANDYQVKNVSVNKQSAIKVILCLFLLFIICFTIISFINYSK